MNVESLTNLIFKSFRELKRWQIVVLAIAVLGSAWATYSIYAGTTSADQLDLAETQQVIPVRYGDLVNQVSTNGSLTFPQRETLSFGTEGTVDRLLVNEGQRVTQGQLLAEIDQSAVVLLEERVAQARVDLKEAQDSLAQLDLDLALELAEAEERVASAEFDLQEARKELDNSQEILTQEELVANARLDLQTAQADLIELTPTYAQQLAEALQTKAEAELTLEEATQAFNNFDLDQALRLAQAQQTKADADETMEEAQAVWDEYQDRNNRWLETALKEKEVAREKLADSQAELDRLLRAQEGSNANLSSFIRQTQEFVEIRTETLQDLEARTGEAANLEAQLEVAQEEALQAQIDLEELLEDSSEADLLEVEAEMKLAQAELDLAIKSLADLEIGVDPLEAALKQTQVDLAEASLKEAEQDLAEMRAGEGSPEIALRHKQVAVAESTLAVAEKELAALSQEQQQLELELRQSQVKSATQELDDALKLLNDSSLKSPIDGLVTLVNVIEGEDVESGTTIVEVVDTSLVEIEGIVDEVDVLLVAEGIPTEVTFDALPGQTFEGTVSEVSPAADNQQGVVTYPIKIQVDLPDTVQPREGLTAVAQIVLDQERDVLLVPQQALYGSFDQPTVRVMTETGIEERPVELGNSDDFWVAVRGGLQEGEGVVMEASEVNTTGSSFRQLRTISGGSRRGR